MLLPDHAIEQLCRTGENPLLIEPFEPQFLQPASYDLHLERQFLFPGANNTPFAAFSARLKPQEMILGCTRERISLPTNLAGEIQGKSGNARRGIQIEAAGHVDPGFCGVITLEIVNFSDMPIVLEHGMGIAKIIFHRLSSPCRKPYEGRHQWAHGPTSS